MNRKRRRLLVDNRCERGQRQELAKPGVKRRRSQLATHRRQTGIARIGEALEPRQLLAIDFPTAAAIQPLGSLAYSSELDASILAPDATETLNFDLDAGQSFSVVIDPSGTLQASVSISTPSGASHLSRTGGAVDEPVFVQSVAAKTAGVYSVRVTGAGGTTGDFNARLLLNGQFEEEAFGGRGNNGIPGGEPLTLASIDGTAASVRSVIGRTDIGDVASNATEDFESGNLSSQWSIDSSTDVGQVQISPETAGEGTNSLVLETSASVPTQEEPPQGVAYVIYDPSSGELSLDTSFPITTLEIDSSSSIFTGDAAQGLGDSVFDVDRDDKIFKLGTDGFDDFSLGNVAPVGLDLEFLNQDLRVDGRLARRRKGRLSVTCRRGNQQPSNLRVGWCDFAADAFVFAHFSERPAYPTAVDISWCSRWRRRRHQLGWR